MTSNKIEKFNSITINPGAIASPSRAVLTSNFFNRTSYKAGKCKISLVKEFDEECCWICGRTIEAGDLFLRLKLITFEETSVLCLPCIETIFKEIPKKEIKKQKEKIISKQVVEAL